MSGETSIYRLAVHPRSTVSLIGLLTLAGCAIDKTEAPVAVVHSGATIALSEIADSGSARAMETVGELRKPAASRRSQISFLHIAFAGPPEDAFAEMFALGDELFDADFNNLDGGGANVGNGMQISRVPRAYLKGEGQWANHVPLRHTGPSAPKAALPATTSL